MLLLRLVCWSIQISKLQLGLGSPVGHSKLFRMHQMRVGVLCFANVLFRVVCLASLPLFARASQTRLPGGPLLSASSFASKRAMPLSASGSLVSSCSCILTTRTSNELKQS